MTTTPIARLIDMVRLSTTGAMDGMVRLEVLNTLREFFQPTDGWLLELPVCIVPRTNDYIVDTCQPSTVVNRLMGLDRPYSPSPNVPWTADYLPMHPPQYLAIGRNYSEPYTEAQNPLFRTRRMGVLLNAGAKCPILRIVQNPNVDEVWIATVALGPTDPMDGDGLPTPPEWIMERYQNYLACGVIARLMLQPGKPYSSLPGAQYNGKKFNEGVGLCRTEIRRMFTYGSQRWGFPGGWKAGNRMFGSHTGYVGYTE